MISGQILSNIHFIYTLPKPLLNKRLSKYLKLRNRL